MAGYASAVLTPLVILLCGLSTLGWVSCDDADEYSFSLIHRDSASSPLARNWTSIREKHLYYLSVTQSRAQHFSEIIRGRRNQTETSISLHRTSENILLSNRMYYYFEYIILVYISDKRVKQFLTYDTGSDLVWIQCKQCRPCFSQPSPVFDFSKSKTAKYLPCSKCSFNSFVPVQCSNKRCVFSYFYSDGSSLSGFMATERFNFGNTKSYDNLIFGCATKSNKLVNNPDGIAGFAPGSTSLPSQLSKSTGRNAFSSCLVRNALDVDTKVIVGPQALSHSGVSYTPIVNPAGSGEPSFYYVEVHQVMVGNRVVKLPYSAFNNEYGTILDSGTPYSALIKQALDPILKEVKRVVGKKLKVVNVSGYQLCYKSSTTDQLQFSKYFPSITFTFKNNVKVKILGYNYMDYIGDGVICGAFNVVSQTTNILGSYFQQNLLVVHDVTKKRIGLKRTVCTLEKRG